MDVTSSISIFDRRRWDFRCLKRESQCLESTSINRVVDESFSEVVEVEVDNEGVQEDGDVACAWRSRED